MAWVGDQLASATAGVSGPVFVVGKSLGTYGARLAAERVVPGDLADAGPDRAGGRRRDPREPGTSAARRRHRRPLWDADVAASLAADGCDVLQLDALDHGLIDPTDAVRSAEALLEITRAMVRFVAG